MTTVEELHDRGVGPRVLAGAEIDTTTANGRLVFGIFAALAEFERELIAERTRAGSSTTCCTGPWRACLKTTSLSSKMWGHLGSLPLSPRGTCSGLRLSSTGPEIIATFGPDYLRLYFGFGPHYVRMSPH